MIGRDAMNQMFDRYVMFVGADFFVEHWRWLAGDRLSAAATPIIQSAARATVTDFMADESTYWNIDFSPERHARSFMLYSEATRRVFADDRRLEEIMRRNFCGDKQEQANVDFAVGFLVLVAKDRDFCARAGVRFEDADVVAAALPSSQDLTLDFYRMERDWLASTSEWDAMIRSLTPDLPAYTVTNFGNAFRATVTLPALVANLSKLLEPSAKLALLDRLNQSMQTQVPPGSSVAVPLILRQQG